MLSKGYLHGKLMEELNEEEKAVKLGIKINAYDIMKLLTRPTFKILNSSIFST